MVISLLNFIQSIEEINIVQHIIKRIKSYKLLIVYNELDGIWSIGPKISSLILRDIVYMYKLENYLKNKELYSYLQPVDTWVHQMSKKLYIISSDRKGIYKGEAQDITRKCLESGVNPIYFNQGVWYLGAGANEILLKNLDRIFIE